MKKVLLCWLGGSDINAAKTQGARGEGPIRMLLQHETFDRICLLHTKDIATEDIDSVKAWLEPCIQKGNLYICSTNVDDPIDYERIYTATLREAEKAVKYTGNSDGNGLVFHISPGTSAMQVVLFLLARLRYPCTRLVQTRTAQQASGSSTVLDVKLPLQVHIRKDAKIIDEHIFCERQGKIEKQAKSIADRKVNILLLGESGTGKSYLAQKIHQWSGRKGEFMAVNCAGLSDEMLQSELFGHVKGAYTGAMQDRKGAFETADNGTLFLDEIGDMPISQQTALLCVLQTDKEGFFRIKKLGKDTKQAVNVRIIAATNKDLIHAIQEGTFRADLYYRLAELTFTLPSMHEYTKAEKDKCLHFFHTRLCKKYGRAWEFAEGAWELLKDDDWAGNIREVEFMLHRICLLSGDSNLILHDIVAEQLQQGRITSRAPKGHASFYDFSLGSGENLDLFLDAIRDRKIEEALHISKNNKAEAARLLGLPYQKLNYRMKT